MSINAYKLMPIALSSVRARGAEVYDRDGDGILSAGDRIVIPTFHRTVDGLLPPVAFDITFSNLADFSSMLTSPGGFWLKRSYRSFGASSGRVHYWYVMNKGRLAIDQVQTLVMSPKGECMSVVEGPLAPEKRECSQFERSLFLDDAEDVVNFINERLIIERHIQAVAELHRLQSEITWLNITEGRGLDFDPAYRGYSFLFSHDGIEMLDALIGGLEKKGGYERRLKEMRFYRSFLVSRWLAKEVEPFADRLMGAVSSAKAEWNGREYPFYDLDSLASEQKTPAESKSVLGLKAGIQREIFNPIFSERDDHLMQSVLKFSPSFSEYIKGLRHIDDLGAMIGSAVGFFAKTDNLYKRLLEAEAKRWLGAEPGELGRQDFVRLFSFAGSEKYFPAEVMYPLLMEMISSMGFPVGREGSGSGITIDDSLHPKKSFSPQALSVSVPDDIRISFRPEGGLKDYEHLLHEIGHALHMSGTTVSEWVFRNLGDRTAGESYAALFGSLITDPDFLRYYRDFVKGWNASAPAKKKVPLLGDAEMGRIVRLGALRDLFMVRRYNYAKVLFEAAHIGGSENLLKEFGFGSLNVSKGAYAMLFGAAGGVEMEDWEAERYLIDTEDDFYAADYARSFLIQPQLSRSMRKEFGDRWFVSQGAGSWLRENLFSHGHFLTPADLNDKFGFNPNDYAEFERDLRWRLLAAERLEKGRSIPQRP